MRITTVIPWQFPGTYIWRGDLTEGFLRYEFGGLIFVGVYTWSGLFSEFYGINNAVLSCGPVYLPGFQCLSV